MLPSAEKSKWTTALSGRRTRKQLLWLLLCLGWKQTSCANADCPMSSSLDKCLIAECGNGSLSSQVDIRPSSSGSQLKRPASAALLLSHGRDGRTPSPLSSKPEWVLRQRWARAVDNPIRGTALRVVLRTWRPTVQVSSWLTPVLCLTGAAPPTSEQCQSGTPRWE